MKKVCLRLFYFVHQVCLSINLAYRAAYSNFQWCQILLKIRPKEWATAHNHLLQCCLFVVVVLLFVVVGGVGHAVSFVQASVLYCCSLQCSFQRICNSSRVTLLKSLLSYSIFHNFCFSFSFIYLIASNITVKRNTSNLHREAFS